MDGVAARSLVFDLFGDYLRYRGGEVRLRTLVALMDSLGVPETAVRVVAARMRRQGWLDSRRDGRETTYVLTAAAWTLLDEGRDRIFSRETAPWDAHWQMIIYTVPESDRNLRQQLRKTLAWNGFGPLSPSVWLSPHDRAGRVRTSVADQPAVRLDVFQARSSGREADLDMAARAWDLDGLNRDYAAVVERYGPRLRAYRRGLMPGEQALLERTQLVHDYRLLPFRDPDLPAELLPDSWSGRRAHEVFLEAHGLLRAPAEAHVDRLIGRRISAA